MLISLSLIAAASMALETTQKVLLGEASLDFSNDVNTFANTNDRRLQLLQENERCQRGLSKLALCHTIILLQPKTDITKLTKKQLTWQKTRIRGRFHQLGCRVYRNLELLLKSALESTVKPQGWLPQTSENVNDRFNA